MAKDVSRTQLISRSRCFYFQRLTPPWHFPSGWPAFVINSGSSSSQTLPISVKQGGSHGKHLMGPVPIDTPWVRKAYSSLFPIFVCSCLDEARTDWKLLWSILERLCLLDLGCCCNNYTWPFRGPPNISHKKQFIIWDSAGGSLTAVGLILPTPTSYFLDIQLSAGTHWVNISQIVLRLRFPSTLQSFVLFSRNLFQCHIRRAL